MKRILYALFLFIPFCLQAQEHHEVGVSLGVANYYGDLQPNIFPSYGYKPMAGILYKYFMSPHIGLRFGASYTALTAADSLSDNAANKARNLSFATHLFEIHGALELNLLPIDIHKKKLTPYIFGGISVFYFNPYADDIYGDKEYLRPLSTEGEGMPMYPDRRQYSLVNMAFPFGGGMKIFIGRRILLCGELGFRLTNTGYLDDVSKSYVNLDTLQRYKGPNAKEMSYRGNTVPGWNGTYPSYGTPRGAGTSNDWYWFGNITCTVYLRNFNNTKDFIKTRCPVLFR